MATPLYRKLRENSFSTFAFPSANEDINKLNFTKFVLLNLDLSKMDLGNKEIFSTESNKDYVGGELLINSLRNYVANQEVVIRESRLNANTYFYDPNEPRTVTERVFWKWLRKSGAIQFEPALPNDEYIDSSEFAVDDMKPDDYFKEYLWKERTTIKYNVVTITDLGETMNHPLREGVSKIFEITLASTTTIKPNDVIRLKSEGLNPIVSNGEELFFVYKIDSTSESRNSVLRILASTTTNIDFIPTMVATVELVYDKTVQYIGEISSHNKVQLANKSYTEILAYIPDQCGQTPDILFRLVADKNYSPSLQYPIIPSQDQPEIVGGELYDNPLLLNPENFAGDHYAYFDVDQKYINSSGQMDRRTGEYFGITESNRKAESVAQAPYVLPAFDGSEIDGITIDFNTEHYSKMNMNRKITNFDDFNGTSFNNQAPKDFEFNTILWFYDVDGVSNLYGATILNPATQYMDGNVVKYKIDTLKKLVANGKQDGLSYQFDLNLNYNINSESVIEAYDSTKVNSLFGMDLYKETMKLGALNNEIFSKLAVEVAKNQTDLRDIKSLIYTQTDIRDINFKIESLYNLLNLYKSNQIIDSETIKVTTDTTSNPPRLMLDSKDSRYGSIYQLPVSALYNTHNNTVIDYKVVVPSGKDFMVNVINDDSVAIELDRKALNIVLERDLDYRQTCVVNIFPNQSQTNKNLNISIISQFVSNVDKKRGESLFVKPFNLPIDTNLNPNVQIEGIIKRWDSIPSNFYPENICIKKISENYFVSIELNSFLINGFKTGDVIMLENFTVSNGDMTPFSGISGQYTIIGDIEDNRINLQTDLVIVQQLFEALEFNATEKGKSEYKIDAKLFIQPVHIRINTGYTITITRTDRVSKSLDEAYMIEVKPFKRENLK
jgi:hypothetical protein